MKNKPKFDKQAPYCEGHFFLSSVAEWQTGRDIEALIKHMRLSPYPFAVYFVPLKEDAPYKIVNYMPDVEGTVCVASYGCFPNEEDV